MGGTGADTEEKDQVIQTSVPLTTKLALRATDKYYVN